MKGGRGGERTAFLIRNQKDHDFIALFLVTESVPRVTIHYV